MEKTINICGKDYKMKSNLHIYEEYKNMFGEELAPAIQQIKNDLASMVETKVVDGKETHEINSDNIGTYVSAITKGIKIAWVMIREEDPSFMSLTEFEKGIDSNLIGRWLFEVLALAFSPFRDGGIHKESN